MDEDDSILSRGARAADQLLKFGDRPDQMIEIRAGRGGEYRPLLMIIHGGFWRPDIDRAHARPMADALAAAGFTVALPEYARVVGNPEATLADLATILSDTPQRVAFHNGQLILIGHSAGGHLALWASAARIGVAPVGTLALAPVADLLLAHELGLGNDAVMRFLGRDPVSRPDLDPRRMRSPAHKTLILHGSNDAIVPMSISESYVGEHSDVPLRRVTDAGHFSLIDPQAAAWAQVLGALSQWVA